MINLQQHFKNYIETYINFLDKWIPVLYHSSFIEFRYQDSKGGWHSEFYRPNEVLSKLDELYEKFLQNKNTYMGIAPRRTKSGGKKDCYFWLYGMIDIDIPEWKERTQTHEEIEQKVDEILKRIPEIFHPNFIAYSGNGLRLYYFFNTVLDEENLQIFKKFVEIMKIFIPNIDTKVYDLARIDRVIGTYNRKNIEKPTYFVKFPCRKEIHDFDEFRKVVENEKIREETLVEKQNENRFNWVKPVSSFNKEDYAYQSICVLEIVKNYNLPIEEAKKQFIEECCNLLELEIKDHGEYVEILKADGDYSATIYLNGNDDPGNIQIYCRNETKLFFTWLKEKDSVVADLVKDYGCSSITDHIVENFNEFVEIVKKNHRKVRFKPDAYLSKYPESIKIWKQTREKLIELNLGKKVKRGQTEYVRIDSSKEKEIVKFIKEHLNVDYYTFKIEINDNLSVIVTTTKNDFGDKMFDAAFRTSKFINHNFYAYFLNEIKHLILNTNRTSFNHIKTNSFISPQTAL